MIRQFSQPAVRSRIRSSEPSVEPSSTMTYSRAKSPRCPRTAASTSVRYGRLLMMNETPIKEDSHHGAASKARFSFPYHGGRQATRRPMMAGNGAGEENGEPLQI